MATSAQTAPSAASPAAGGRTRTGAGAPARKKGKVKMFPKKELIKLCRGMSSMLGANISTSESIGFYCQGLSNQALREALKGIKHRIDAGMPVHSAFAKSERFDQMFIATIQAGGDAGKLNEAFSALGKRIKTQSMFTSKLRGALTVPCLLIVFQIALFIWSQINVVSKVEETLKGVHADPDQLSAMIFSMSHVVRQTWPVIVGAMVTFAVALVRSSAFRAFLLNALMKKWTLLRKLVMGLRQNAFLGTLHMMYANGINLSEASVLAAKAVQGTAIFEQLMIAAKRYRTSGVPYADALKKYTTLDAQVSHLIGIGEKSASLPQQLDLLNLMYEEDTAAYMADFTQIINVLTLLFAVMLLGVIFAGSMLPIFLMGPRMMTAANH